MSEEQNKQFYIQRVYTKDLSFESPNSPAIFLQEWKPDINVTLDNKAQAVGEGLYEVLLYVSVTAKQDDKTTFMVEIQQGGIFLAQGFSEDELEPLLHMAAPNILFPYARELISDLVNRGSFPQFLMQPVNFEAIYHERKQRAAAAADNESGPDESTKH